TLSRVARETKVPDIRDPVAFPLQQNEIRQLPGRIRGVAHEHRRALVTNPRILIFDEATSALDYESERMIQQNMAEIAKGRTVFIIAHRLSTVRRTARIITIEAGRIIEDGTHDDLISTGGRYASLYRLQAGIQEVRQTS